MTRATMNTNERPFGDVVDAKGDIKWPGFLKLMTKAAAVFLISAVLVALVSV